MNKWFAGCDNVKLFELHKNKQKQNKNTHAVRDNYVKGKVSSLLVKSPHFPGIQ